MEEFPYITVSFATENLPVLVYVAGFVASKVTSKLNCSNCKKILSPGKNVINAEIDSSLNEYFNNLNRGGLTYPSSILLHTFQASYSIFNTCISSNLEEKFLNLKNQKAVLLDLNSNFWKFSDYLQINSMCSNPTCGKEQPIFKKFVSIYFPTFYLITIQKVKMTKQLSLLLLRQKLQNFKSNSNHIFLTYCTLCC